MTEAEWLACTDPGAMLRSTDGGVSDRRLRLLLVACYRRLGPLLGEVVCRQAVGVLERVADGLAGREEVGAALAAVLEAFHGAGPPPGDRAVIPPVVLGVRAALSFSRDPRPGEDDGGGRSCGLVLPALRLAADAAELGAEVAWWAVWAWGRAGAAERRAQAGLLREILGNPFRPVSVEAAWLSWDGGTVPRLARAAYEERRLPEGTLDPARLAVLADALEEAGCTNPDILGHLRGPGPHVRGCWAVDLLLGRG